MRENFFQPLHMDTSSFFLTPEVEKKLTRLYHPDGKTPYPYWHITMRPAGAVNASAREMANYVQFFLNRGSFGGLQLVQAASIERMERPATTLAANEGMIAGYGLGNYTTIEDGFVYHGHNGGVEGDAGRQGFASFGGKQHFAPHQRRVPISKITSADGKPKAIRLRHACAHQQMPYWVARQERLTKY